MSQSVFFDKTASEKHKDTLWFCFSCFCFEILEADKLSWIKTRDDVFYSRRFACLILIASTYISKVIIITFFMYYVKVLILAAMQQINNTCSALCIWCYDK